MVKAEMMRKVRSPSPLWMWSPRLGSEWFGVQAMRAVRECAEVWSVDGLEIGALEVRRGRYWACGWAVEFECDESEVPAERAGVDVENVVIVGFCRKQMLRRS